ncbi:integrase core domain protein [Trichonephila clavata]|uniref:Integrase core domain protein n=1 Tax=Trichonephila clavata TaxID=2740835 RepID=A0A8X6H0Q7_TRICU|nr:integrase core domain protein [Trichonephila clavata]
MIPTLELLLLTERTAITAADLLNDRVIPSFDEQKVSLLRILTDRGTEYCGRPENHAYQLYLGVENIDHSRTKARSPQTNGICERFHRTMQDECYNIIFRKKIYTSLAELQLDVDHWVHSYNRSRPHSDRFEEILGFDPEEDLCHPLNYFITLLELKNMEDFAGFLRSADVVPEQDFIDYIDGRKEQTTELLMMQILLQFLPILHIQSIERREGDQFYDKTIYEQE